MQNIERLQIAGHSQSPAGSLATTSTRPYRMALLPLVFKRAERTELITVPKVLLECTEHASLVVPVQDPSPPACVRFKV